MIIATTAAQLPARSATRAVVMTMGALHEGHLELVRQARARADQVIVTIFVNPLQFTDPADLERYPRTFDADCALLEREGADAVYAPTVEEMYPGGDPTVTVSAGAIGDVFEGEHRPGHFDGMLTVVLKLLHITAPDVAFFGAKDAQQVIAVRTMVRDLSMPVRIETVTTVREADGLALSSRNVHLSPAERDHALVLYAALSAAREKARNGASVADVITAGRSVLDRDTEGRATEGRDTEGRGFEEPAAVDRFAVDYFAVLDPDSAQAVPADYRGDAVIAVAAVVGDTRLIDNVTASIGPDRI